MVKNKKIGDILLHGNVLCLDFVNSIHDRINEPDHDYLSNAADLFYWAVKAGVINTKTCNTSLKDIGDSSSQANKVLKDAKLIRELLYKIFKAISQHKRVNAQDLQVFNELLSKCFSRVEIITDGMGFTKDWKVVPGELLLITAPIIHSAYELLLSEKLDRVKECPNCGWLFLDTSKNGKRRWCSMKTCGSIVKALDWYHRQKTHA
jgi:predicted RNA-binding Zn ribbon-like protein